MAITIDTLGGAIRRFHRMAEENREVLDALNVFPTADADAGTNLEATVSSLVTQLDAAHGDVGRAVQDAEARGTVGRILLAVVGGLAEVVTDAKPAPSTAVAEALRAASDHAHRTVSDPADGSALTVVEAAARAAEATVSEGLGSMQLLQTAYRRACEALAETPDRVEALAKAGVVDAGGAAVAMLLAAMLDVDGAGVVPLPEVVWRRESETAVGSLVSPLEPRYEVMFRLEADDGTIDSFREHWSTLGESAVVVGGDGAWNCHIHTALIGPAIEMAIAVGRPSEIRVTPLDHASAVDISRGSAVGFEPIDAVARSVVGVVAIVDGQGLVDRFRSLGVQGVVPSGGRHGMPSVAQLLAVVDSIPAVAVIILPNGRNAVPVAEQIDNLTTKRVVVVPTRSPAQGVAAMAAYDPATLDLPGTAEDMAAAASATITGELVRATRDATVSFGTIAEGDWLGIADGTVVVADRDLESALRGLVAAILPIGSETLTLYTGEGAPVSSTKALVAWIDELYPRLRVVHVAGGQPESPFLVAIE